MRHGFGVALLLAATFPVTAMADNIVGVTVNGSLADSSSFSAAFTLNLNDPSTTGTPGATSIYSFADPMATVNGMPTSLTINVGESFDGDTVELTDGSTLFEAFDFAANGSTLFFDPSVPTFNPGTYNGFDFACSAKNEAPAQGLPATLAMLQMPAVPCGLQLVASSVTPEPTSIALLATGMLGLGGIVRRRYTA